MLNYLGLDSYLTSYLPHCPLLNFDRFSYMIAFAKMLSHPCLQSKSLETLGSLCIFLSILSENRFLVKSGITTKRQVGNWFLKRGTMKRLGRGLKERTLVLAEEKEEMAENQRKEDEKGVECSLCTLHPSLPNFHCLIKMHLRSTLWCPMKTA